MDEETLRGRAEAWRLRALDSHDTRERAANLLIAAHYSALADLMAGKSTEAGRVEEA